MAILASLGFKAADGHDIESVFAAIGDFVVVGIAGVLLGGLWELWGFGWGGSARAVDGALVAND